MNHARRRRAEGPAGHRRADTGSTRNLDIDATNSGILTDNKGNVVNAGAGRHSEGECSTRDANGVERTEPVIARTLTGSPGCVDIDPTRVGNGANLLRSRRIDPRDHNEGIPRCYGLRGGCQRCASRALAISSYRRASPCYLCVNLYRPHEGYEDEQSSHTLNRRPCRLCCRKIANKLRVRCRIDASSDCLPVTKHLRFSGVVDLLCRWSRVNWRCQIQWHAHRHC